jgi:hypothetical protein
MSERILLDPGAERDPAARAPLPRPERIEGLTVGLLDISKPRGDVFLDELESLLGDEGVTVARYAKPTFTRPAPTELRARIAEECDLVVEALAD